MKIIFLLFMALHANASLRTLTFGKDIHAREARAWEYEKASQQQSHSDFQFKIDDRAALVGQQVQLSGHLLNTSPVKKLAYIVGDVETLTFDVENVKLKPSAPHQAHPPALFALEIPANADVKFTATRNLDELDYTGSPDVKLKWTFQYWTSPKPSGEVGFKLPTAKEAKVAPLKITFQKYTSDDSAKLVASLLNVSNEPQIFCKQTPANLGWSLTHHDGSPFDVVEILNVDYEPRALIASDCFVLRPNEAKELDSANVKHVGDTYEFDAPFTKYKDVHPGTYQVHFSALNSAFDGDAKVVDQLRAKHNAAKPVHAIEITAPISIP